jgi:hypothetical protein
MSEGNEELSKYSKCHIGDDLNELGATWIVNCPDFINGWCKNKSEHSKICKFKGKETYSGGK